MAIVYSPIPKGSFRYSANKIQVQYHNKYLIPWYLLQVWFKLYKVDIGI
jgi:hypothetical protein